MDQEGGPPVNKGPLTRRRSGVVSTPERVLRSRGEKSDGSPPTSATSSRKESTPSRAGTPKRTLKKSTDISTLTPSRRSARASSAQPEESHSNSKVSTRRRSSSLQPESPLKISTVTTRSKLSIDKSVAAVSTRSRKSLASSSTSPNSSNTSSEPVKEIKRITRRSESNSPAREVVSRATKTTRRSSLPKASDLSPVGSPDSETSSDKTPSHIPRKGVVKNLALSPVQEIKDEPLVIDSSGVSPKLASTSHPAELPFVKKPIVKVEPISPDQLTSNLDVNIKSESLSPNDSISNDKNESRAESEDSGIKEMEEFNPLEDKCVEVNSEIYEDQNNDPNSKSNLSTMADRERLSKIKNVCNIPKYRSLDKGKIGNPVVSLVRISPESIAESSGSKYDDGNKSGLDKLKKDLKSFSNTEKPKAFGKKDTSSTEEISSNDKNLPESDIPLIKITSVLEKDKPMNESITDQLLTEIIEENNIKCTPLSKTSCQKTSLISGKSQEDNSEEDKALKSPKSLDDKPSNDSTASEDLDFKLAIDNESPSDSTVEESNKIKLLKKVGGESMEEKSEGNLDKSENSNLSEENSETVGLDINNSLKTDSFSVKGLGVTTKVAMETKGDIEVNPLSSGNSKVLSESVIPKDVINSSTPTVLSIDCSQQLNKSVTEFKFSEKVISSDSSLHALDDSLSESQIDTNYSILVNVSSDSIIDKTEEPKNSQDFDVSVETSVKKSQLSANISDEKENNTKHFDYLPKDSLPGKEESSEKKICDGFSEQLETSLEPEDSFSVKQNLDSGKEVLKRRSSGLSDNPISEINTTPIEQDETSFSRKKNAALSDISDEDVNKSKEYETFKIEKELTGKVKTGEPSVKEDSSNNVTVTSQSDKEASKTRVESDICSDPVEKIGTHKEVNLKVGNDSSDENNSISKNMDQAATFETPDDGHLNKSTCVDIPIRDVSDNRSLQGGDFDKGITLDSISNNSNEIQSQKQNDGLMTSATQDHSLTDSFECTSNQTITKDSVEESTVIASNETVSKVLQVSKDHSQSSGTTEELIVDTSQGKSAADALESSKDLPPSSDNVEESNVDASKEKPATEGLESSQVPAESSETIEESNVDAPEEKPAAETSESSHIPAKIFETIEESNVDAPGEKLATEALESSQILAESSETIEESNVDAPGEKPASEASDSSLIPAKSSDIVDESILDPANIKIVSEAVEYSEDLSKNTDSGNESKVNKKNVGSEEGLNNSRTTTAGDKDSFFANTSDIKFDVKSVKCSTIEEPIDANKCEAKSAPVGTLQPTSDLLKCTATDKESTDDNISALSGVLLQECPSLSPNIVTVEKTAGLLTSNVLNETQVIEKTNDVTRNDSEESTSNSTLKSKEDISNSFAFTGIFNETIGKVETDDTANSLDSLLTQTDKEVDSIVGTQEEKSDNSYTKNTSLKEDVYDVKTQSNDCKDLSTGECKETKEQNNSTIDSLVTSSPDNRLLMNKSKSDPLHLDTLPIDSATSFEENCPKTNSVRDDSNKSHSDLNSSSVSDKSLTSQNSTLEYQKNLDENSFEETSNVDVDVISHQDMSVSEATCSKRDDVLISSDSSKMGDIIDKEKSCPLIENVEVISDESMEPLSENAFTKKDQLNNAFNDTIVVSDSNHSHGSNDIITVNSSGDENREMFISKEVIAESVSDNIECSTGSFQITQSTKNDDAIEGNETHVINQVELVSSVPAVENKIESHKNLLKVDDELPSNKDEKSEIISSSSSSDDEVITGRDFLDDEAEEGEETDEESSDSSFKPSAIVHIKRVKRKVSSKKKRPFQISHTSSDNQSSSSEEFSLVKSKKTKASWVVNSSEDISSSGQSNLISAGVNFTSDEGVQKKEKAKANVKCQMKKSKTKVPTTSEKPIHAPLNSIVEPSIPINSCGTSWKVTRFTYNEKELNECEKKYNFTGCGTEFKVSNCEQSYIRNRLSGNLNNSHAAGGIFSVQNAEDVKKLSRSLHSKKYSCNSHFMVKNWIPVKNLANAPFSSGTIFEVTQDPTSLKTKKRKANINKIKTFESQLVSGDKLENSGDKSSKKAIVKSTDISESVDDHILKHPNKKIKLDIHMKSAGSAINVSRDPNLFIQNYNLGGGGKDSDSIILEMAFPPMKKCPVPCYSASILNLSTSFNAHDLYNFFSKHRINDIEEINLTCPPRLFSQGIGFGTIRFSDEDAMQACIDLSFEKKLDGKELWMTPCVCYKPKSKKSSIWFVKTIKKFLEKERNVSFMKCTGSK